MAKRSIQPGAEIDGFTVGECVHRGGMATLWSVTHPDIDGAAADEDAARRPKARTRPRSSASKWSR